MTLWNPLNVFSSSQRRAGNVDPASSFDPSRTGDPLGPGYNRPAIGFGDTGPGEPSGYGESRRRPIGFAPPEEDAEQRYRTEISFKRHHELPRASVTSDRPDDVPQESWETPETGFAEGPAVSFDAASPFAEDPEPEGLAVDGADEVVAHADDPEGADEPAVTEEKVPFFKREISFRRKRTPEPEPVAEDEDVVAEDEPVEIAADADADEWIEPVDVDDESDVPEAEVFATHGEDDPVEEQAEDAQVEETPAAEVVADADVVAEEPAEGEPAVEPVEAVDEESAEAPVAAATADTEEKVPFYKRELSFRRKNAAAAAAVVAADDDESPDTPDADQPEAADALDAWVVPVAASAEDEPSLGVDVEVDVEVEVEVEVLASGEDVPVDHEHVEDEPEAGPDQADEPSVEIAAAAAEPADEPDHLIEEPAEEFGHAAALVDEVEPAGLSADEHPDDFDISEDSFPVPVPVPVGAWDDDATDDGVVSEGDDALFIEDTPPPEKAGRFARKEKSTDSSPKRKQTRGGKGRRVVGLKIGASQLAAAVVVESDGGLELVELARRPLAAGIVVDGEVRDLDALANAVKAFFDEERLPKRDVRIGLASNRIGVRTFDIVGIDDEAKFDNAVRFKAHEVLPVAAHESVLDYRVLEERPNEAGEPLRRVLLVVAPRDQVEPYTEVANRAGIKLAGIDLEALGLLRAFVEPKPFAVRAVDDTATVVVSIGHESSTLLVSGGGTCEFTRVFDWGGSALEEAIATTLEVHPAEAATILRHLSLSGPGRQFDALDEASRARALDAVRLRLTPFARELVASLQFYQTQPESLGIGGILITGGTSHLEGLADALHQMIGVNVAVGDPLGRVRHSGAFDPAVESAIGSMAVPIGLAIDDLAMRGVNLLPKDAGKSGSRIPDLKKIAVPVAVAVPLVALGFLYLGAHGKVSDTSTELQAVNAELAALPEPQGPDIDAGIQGDEAARATAVASVIGGRLAWDAVFRDLARVLPANVWLTKLSAALPESTGGNLAAGATTPVAAVVPGQLAPPPTAVTIDGYTYTQPDVARLLARLATLPSLTRVTLTSSSQEQVNGKDVVHFTIVADLSQTGGQS